MGPGSPRRERAGIFSPYCIAPGEIPAYFAQEIETDSRFGILNPITHQGPGAGLHGSPLLNRSLFYSLSGIPGTPLAYETE